MQIHDGRQARKRQCAGRRSCGAGRTRRRGAQRFVQCLEPPLLVLCLVVLVLCLVVLVLLLRLLLLTGGVQVGVGKYGHQGGRRHPGSRFFADNRRRGHPAVHRRRPAAGGVCVCRQVGKQPHGQPRRRRRPRGVAPAAALAERRRPPAHCGMQRHWVHFRVVFVVRQRRRWGAEERRHHVGGDTVSRRPEAQQRRHQHPRLPAGCCSQYAGGAGRWRRRLCRCGCR